MINLLAIALFYSGYAQENNSETIGKVIEDLTFQWDLESDNLNSYDGLTKFCLDQEYRGEVIDMLNKIHHYDSVLYQRLVKAAHYNHDSEIEKTLKEISKFEDKYNMKSFIHFLHDECNARKEIENNAEETRNELAQNSYDAQVYVVETEINKFIKHVTKRVDHIRQHVHHLHIN